MRPSRLLGSLVALVLVVAACAERTTDTTTAPTQPPQVTTTAQPGTTQPPPPPPDEIVLGQVIALSGPNAGGAGISQIPSVDLWVADVNARGGIYVAEYDTRIPVRVERVDSESDRDRVVGLVEQMLTNPDIHFVLSPWGTGNVLALLELVDEYQNPMLACTMSSADMYENPGRSDYMYVMLNQPHQQGADLVELLIELGVNTVSLIHHNDDHGLEVRAAVGPLFEAADIEISFERQYTAGTTDFEQLLRDAQAAGAQAFLAFAYPPEAFAIVNQMAGIGFNPDLFSATVGIAFPVFPGPVAGAAAEGVMGTGVWNPNVDIEGARDFFDRHVAMHGAEPDRWASAACYAGGEVLEQAIEAAGTLDRVAVRQALDSTEFRTIVGTFRFVNNFNPVYPGGIGQWQSGEFEIVSPTSARTADPIFPKPPWPTDN